MFTFKQSNDDFIIGDIDQENIQQTTLQFGKYNIEIFKIFKTLGAIFFLSESDLYFDSSSAYIKHSEFTLVGDNIRKISLSKLFIHEEDIRVIDVFIINSDDIIFLLKNSMYLVHLFTTVSKINFNKNLDDIYNIVPYYHKEFINGYALMFFFKSEPVMTIYFLKNDHTMFKLCSITFKKLVVTLVKCSIISTQTSMYMLKYNDGSLELLEYMPKKNKCKLHSVHMDKKLLVKQIYRTWCGTIIIIDFKNRMYELKLHSKFFGHVANYNLITKLKGNYSISYLYKILYIKTNDSMISINFGKDLEKWCEIKKFNLIK